MTQVSSNCFVCFLSLVFVANHVQKWLWWVSSMSNKTTYHAYHDIAKYWNMCLLIDCLLPCLACRDITGCCSICDSSLAHVEFKPDSAGAFTCRFRQLKEGHNQKQTTRKRNYVSSRVIWKWQQILKMLHKMLHSCKLYSAFPFLTSIWFRYWCLLCFWRFQWPVQ